MSLFLQINISIPTKKEKSLYNLQSILKSNIPFDNRLNIELIDEK